MSRCCDVKTLRRRDVGSLVDISLLTRRRDVATSRRCDVTTLERRDVGTSRRCCQISLASSCQLQIAKNHPLHLQFTKQSRNKILGYNALI